MQANDKVRSHDTPKQSAYLPQNLESSFVPRSWFGLKMCPSLWVQKNSGADGFSILLPVKLLKDRFVFPFCSRGSSSGLYVSVLTG